MTVPQTAIVQGDARSYSIAAASVLAKVTRDRLMLEFDRQWAEIRICRAQRLRHGATSAAIAAHGRARSTAQLRAVENNPTRTFLNTDEYKSPLAPALAPFGREREKAVAFGLWPN